MRGQRLQVAAIVVVVVFLGFLVFGRGNYGTSIRRVCATEDKRENDVTKAPIHPDDDVENLKKQFTVKNKVPRESTTKPDNKRFNVLFMITDDMRPQLGSYLGQDYANPTIQQKMVTPYLDDLAGKSLLLKRAYTQYSLCGPSRASMLTSRRPDTTRIYGNDLYWRVAGGNYTTLPQHFKEQGYQSIGMGKIYHQHKSSNNQDPISWSEPHFDPPYGDGHHYKLDSAGYKGVSTKDRETLSPLTDEFSMKEAKKKLEEIAPKAKTGEQPFFFGMGFMKPHLNFVCPKRFFNMYDIEQGKQYLSELSWQRPLVSQYCNMANVTIENDEKRITDEGLRYLRRAYFGCISYVDSMVGELLDELDKNGLTDNTVVVFVADHGHHLGENEAWGKQTHYESSVHIPMMIHIPGRTDHGVATRSLVEGVDLYPSVVEAAGLEPIPQCEKNPYNTATCTEGESILSLIDEPDEQIKPAVFSQLKEKHNYMSYSIRTDRYKFKQYAKIQKSESELEERDSYSIQWDNKMFWSELYDLELDPEERVNRTDHATYAGIRKVLETKLHQAITDVDDVPRLVKE